MISIFVKFFFYGAIVISCVVINLVYSYCRFPSYKAKYALYVNGVSVGRAVDIVSRVGRNRFIYNQTASAEFLMLSDKITSNLSGVITNNGFRPLHLDFKRKWRNGKINRNYKSGQYGPQSYLLQIRYGLLKNRISSRMKVFVSKNKVADFLFYKYSVREYNSSLLGKVMLTPVSFVSAGGFYGVDWYSKKYGYLLVYSVKRKKGSRIVLTQELISYKPDYKLCVIR